MKTNVFQPICVYNNGNKMVGMNPLCESFSLCIGLPLYKVDTDVTIV